MYTFIYANMSIRTCACMRICIYAHMNGGIYAQMHICKFEHTPAPTRPILWSPSDPTSHAHEATCKFEYMYELVDLMVIWGLLYWLQNTFG